MNTPNPELTRTAQLMNRLTWHKHATSMLLGDKSVQAEWDRLSAFRLDLPFLCADAVGAALAVFGTGQEKLVIGSHGREVQAMLVLVPDGRLRWRTFQPSQLPLGSWVAAPGHDLPSLCRSLLRGPLGLCLVLSITQVDPLQAPREADAGDTRHADYIPTAWVSIEGGFDDYWAARGKNLRQNLRKQRNKLAAEGHTTQMQVLQAPGDMPGAIERYGALEAAGWKADRGTAIHPSNDQGRFYTQLLQDAARQNQARVYEYLLDGRTVAMNLCLLRGGTLVVLKTTYDESLPKNLSPAFLLREEELQRFFVGQEVQRVEYYGRVMDWHTKLTEAQRTLYHLTAYRWPLLKRLTERRGAAQLSAQAAAPTEAQAQTPPPDAEPPATPAAAAPATARAPAHAQGPER